jgi:hypothetical protein
MSVFTTRGLSQNVNDMGHRSQVLGDGVPQGGG